MRRLIQAGVPRSGSGEALRFSGRLRALPDDDLRKTLSAGFGRACTDEMYSVRRRKDTAVSPILGLPRVESGRRRRRSCGWTGGAWAGAWMAAWASVLVIVRG